MALLTFFVAHRRPAAADIRRRIGPPRTAGTPARCNRTPVISAVSPSPNRVMRGHTSSPQRPRFPGRKTGAAVRSPRGEAPPAAGPESPGGWPNAPSRKGPLPGGCVTRSDLAQDGFWAERGSGAKVGTGAFQGPLRHFRIGWMSCAPATSLIWTRWGGSWWSWPATRSSRSADRGDAVGHARGAVADQARTRSPAGAFPPARGGDGLHPLSPLLGRDRPSARGGDPSAVGRGTPCGRPGRTAPRR